jgi:hypothetical protein
MAKNCGKIVLLLIPCLATTCLLAYCLLSDAWVNTDTARLNNITRLFEAQFEAFVNGSAAAVGATDSKVRVVPLSDQSRFKVTAGGETTSSTTPTTTTSKSSTTASNDVHNVDYMDEEYTDEGSNASGDSNYARKLKRRNLMGKKENLFHSNLNSDEQFKAKMRDDNDDDVMDADEAEADSENERGGVKLNKLDEQQQATSNNQHHRIDYIYVTKLWPLVKSKSLYSDCVEYHKLRLKLSLGYLTLDKKEPIGGQLHYYDNAAYFTDEQNPAGSCQKKAMIYCNFTKTCKQGKRY